MSEYILLSREERRFHLKLEQPCIMIGGYDSREYRGLLAHYLRTEIPTHEKTKILLCHACNNSGCSNVNHLYWGTSSDNIQDSQEIGTWSNIYERTLKKYGDKKTLEMYKTGGSKGGRGNKGKTRISEEQLKIYKKTITEYLPIKKGDITRISRELGLSHTHVSRLIKKNFPMEKKITLSDPEIVTNQEIEKAKINFEQLNEGYKFSYIKSFNKEGDQVLNELTPPVLKSVTLVFKK